MPNQLPPPYQYGGDPYINEFVQRPLPNRQRASSRRGGATYQPGRKATASPARGPRPRRRGRRSGCLRIILILLLIAIASVLLIRSRRQLIPKIETIFKPTREASVAVVVPELYSESLILVDLKSGDSLFAKDEDTRRAPASLTKMMTVLVALEADPDLDAIVEIDTESYQRMVARDSSLAGFYGREPVTIRDLLYGTMLPSGGEAASTLALVIGGTEADFVHQMNRKAESIGMRDTHFVNPTGLDDPAQYSTAADLAKLVREAVNNPEFYKVFTATDYTSSANLNHPDGILFNNSILRSMGDQEDMAPGVRVIGGKAGYTKTAGRCWASLLKKGNREYVAVTLASPPDQLEPLGQMVDTIWLSTLIP